MIRQSASPEGEVVISDGDEGGWLPTAAFAFVIFSLIALVALPTILLNRMIRAEEEMASTILPANDALRELAFAMEERVTSARSSFTSDDPRYAIRLEAAARAEVEALGILSELAPRFGVATNEYFEALQRHMVRRDSIERRVLEQRGELEAYQAALPEFDAVRDSMWVELDAFRAELMEAQRARSADEARWALLQRRLSLLLGAMAIIAALLVGWSARRQRRLRREVQQSLVETNRQRKLAERRGDELERATEARARLLRGVTHDVKNPLGAARGYAELLEMGIKGPLTPEQLPLAAGVIRSIDAALGIIADLLDLARADSGGLTVNRVQLDLRTVLKEAAEAHRPAAVAAGHSLDIELPDDRIAVHTDPGRVTQILGNLLSNAVKYTPAPGRILVHADGMVIEDGGVEGVRGITVAVSDTGPGIPAEQREAIFDEFTRLNDAGMQKGNGLGLAIARRIARLLGGDLTVEEAAIGGASFILWLPIRQEDEVPVAAGGLAGTARRK